jgi:plastocyanin
MFIRILLLVLLFGFSNTHAQSGAIHGKISLKGPFPKLDRATCITPEVCGATHSYDRLIVGGDRGIEYTLIYLKNPPAGRASLPAPSIKQEHCTFEPHMQLASRGAQITFENDDPVLHNCHGYYFVGADRTTAFNVAQPMKGQRSQETLRKPGMVNIECDAGHTWMSAWVWVTDSPFAAVSDEHGNFSIPNVPAGSYTLVMWHEGWKPSGMRDGRPVFSAPILEERQITVIAGGNTEANFELQ